jgi:predicted SnoaL-like aldol condensation-catalyzing enzyme
VVSVGTNKMIVRDFFEGVFNQRNMALIDEFIAPDYTNHSRPIKMSGPEGAKQTIAAELQAFPDLHTTIEDIIAEGDRVVVRCIDHFTRQSDGAKLTLPWIEILRLEKDKAIEAWFEADLTPILADFNGALEWK